MDTSHSEEAVAIGDALAANTTLLHLDLSGNQFSESVGLCNVQIRAERLMLSGSLICVCSMSLNRVLLCSVKS